MKADEFVKMAIANGWVKIRQSGSHVIFKKGSKTYPGPYHRGDDIGKGLERKMRKDMELK